jgi:hypothetical protein
MHIKSTNFWTWWCIFPVFDPAKKNMSTSMDFKEQYTVNRFPLIYYCYFWTSTVKVRSLSCVEKFEDSKEEISRKSKDWQFNGQQRKNNSTNNDLQIIRPKKIICVLFTVCTEITIILGTVRFKIRGSRLRYKRYDAHFLKKSGVELPFSSFGDHLINILRKVNRLIYAFKINESNIYNVMCCVM